MKPTPAGWPRLSTALFYDDAAGAIDWLCAAFGFAVRLKVTGEGGRIEHSELTYGEAVVMVAQSKEKWGVRLGSPRGAGGVNTQSAMVFVDDADAHCARARAAGAEITVEPADHDYGADYWVDRSYGAKDCEGHLWWFTQRLRG